MVAVVKTGHSILRILNYNENKVGEGVARLLDAVNFPLDAQDMSFTMKHKFFKNQLELNQNVTRNSVHISLNFHNSEKDLDDEKLLSIANDYMKGIGFKEQPFLVYQHNDAGHPHIHIVSIKVQADGKRIDMDNIGRNQSEETRKLIEERYRLVKAEDGKKKVLGELPEKITSVRADYGKMETKRAIQNVLEAVIDKYKYSSLQELNAVLRLYNVEADPGTKESNIFKHGGLLYHIVGPNGQPIGIPIKASAFYNKPTLKNLQDKFVANEALKPKHKARVKNAVDGILNTGKANMVGLVEQLKKLGIDAIVRQNEQGFIYGITYVDHQSKCVFNGSDLGKAYSAKVIQERCTNGRSTAEPNPSGSTLQKDSGLQPSRRGFAAEAESSGRNTGGDLLGDLLKIEYGPNYLPKELKARRRKKRNK